MHKARGQAPSAPLLGSFPLDHGGVCKTRMRAFLSCLSLHDSVTAACRSEERQYLECRMDASLMGKEDLDTLGFEARVAPELGQAQPLAPKEPPQELIAGLAAATRASGAGAAAFGFGGKRGGGH